MILHLNGYQDRQPTVLARLPKAELRRTPARLRLRPDHVTGDGAAAVHRRRWPRHGHRPGPHRHHPARRAQGRCRRPPRWPVIVLRTQGAGPARPGSTACPWRTPDAPTRCPVRRADRSGAPRPAGAVAALLPARGAVRRRRGTPAAVLATVRGEHVDWAPPPANGRTPAARRCPAATGEVRRPRRRTRCEHARGHPECWATCWRTSWPPPPARRDFRLVGPDETASTASRPSTPPAARRWQERTLPVDEDLDRHGPCDGDPLRTHLPRAGWRATLTGRHGLFSCYEAFVHIVDSAGQPAH
ncbi:hypothetical protein LV779_08705 [Streptomyces thinghirensis]|nr:hypothetical protein [Streptomyces thinghirensis]